MKKETNKLSSLSDKRQKLAILESSHLTITEFIKLFCEFFVKPFVGFYYCRMWASKTKFAKKNKATI